MKADEPGVPLVKYGMVAEAQDSLVERHFQVTLEEKVIDGVLFQQNLARAQAVLPLLKR